jgi:cysteine desulfurase
MQPIYLDNNATTPVLPDVMSAMIPYFQRNPGNPSSAHTAGSEARSAVEHARSQVAQLVTAPSSHVLFTASATEAINTAFHSISSRRKKRLSRIVITAVEHAAVRECAHAAENLGAKVIKVSVNDAGELDFEQLTEAVSSDTCIVSVMWANNETGVIFPILQIAQLCADRRAPLHVDAVQAAGKLPINLERVPIDYLTISAHKLFGPKGAGALIASPQSVRPLLRGGGQEGNRRAGTENVPAIVGFGEAARLAALELEQRAKITASFRDRLEQVLFQNIKGCYINGAGQPRISNTANLGFDSVDGDTLAGVLNASGVYVSTGSACNAETLTPSHVLMAMTGSYERAAEAVRFSLSHLNTESEIERTIAAVEEAVATLRLMRAHA